jgi:hypothetical protein
MAWGLFIQKVLSHSLGLIDHEEHQFFDTWIVIIFSDSM